MEERGVRVCGENYRVISPKYTTLSLKNFRRAVDLHPKEKWPCKNSWHEDLRLTHIRNKRLLDLPYKTPKCCSEIYNAILDRNKLKKVKKFGLTRAVRPVTFGLEKEEVFECRPQEDLLIFGQTKATYFPECYILSESESDGEDDEYQTCESGSESECSGCSTLGGGTRKKLHKVVKRTWRDLLHQAGEELCRKTVAEELIKHKNKI